MVVGGRVVAGVPGVGVGIGGDAASMDVDCWTPSDRETPAAAR
jgi:hypothetical protein